MQEHLSVEAFKAEANKKRSARSAKHAEERRLIDARCDSYRVSAEPVQVRLPLPPPLDHYYRTTIIAGHSATYISTEGREYRQEVVRLWKSVGITFEGRLAIKVVVVFRDRREPDLDGLWKALLDSLNHAGAFRNDKQIKAESMEQERTEAPGWVDIVLGPKPGTRQGTVFSTNW